MPPTVKLGYGSLFQRGDGGSPESFTTIAESLEFTPPQMTRPAVDATTHDSADGYREFIAGLKDAGEIGLQAHYLPANATHGFTTGLGADFEAGTLRNFKIVLAESLGTWTFAGIVTAFRPALPLDGKMGLSVTIKVSGKPTFTG